MTMLTDIRILATGAYVPERVVTNLEVVAGLDTTDAWVVEHTGICERRFAADSQATSDLAVEAGRRALQRAGIAPDDIDLVIVATSSPDWMQPATAAAVHGGLGMRATSGAMDVNVVCSGFVYALHTGAALLASEPAWRSVLVIGAECYSRITNPDDRTTRIFFGDGAGAVVLGRGESALLSTHYGVDFSQHEAIIVPAGGTREPASAASVATGRTKFAMDGPAVKRFAVEHVAAAVGAACDAAGVSPSDLALLVPHQSNLRLIEATRDDLGLDADIVAVTVDRYGNTAGASIPITLDDANSAGRLVRGDLVCLVGYGGGLSWASLVLRW